MNTPTLLATLAALIVLGNGLKCYSGCGMTKKGSNDSVVVSCDSVTQRDCDEGQVCAYGNYSFNVGEDKVPWRVEQATCSENNSNETVLCDAAKETWTPREGMSDWECAIKLCNTTLCNSHGFTARVSLIIFSGSALLLGLL